LLRHLHRIRFSLSATRRSSGLAGTDCFSCMHSCRLRSMCFNSYSFESSCRWSSYERWWEISSSDSSLQIVSHDV